MESSQGPQERQKQKLPFYQKETGRRGEVTLPKSYRWLVEEQRFTQGFSEFELCHDPTVQCQTAGTAWSAKQPL